MRVIGAATGQGFPRERGKCPKDKGSSPNHSPSLKSQKSQFKNNTHHSFNPYNPSNPGSDNNLHHHNICCITISMRRSDGRRISAKNIAASRKVELNLSKTLQKN